MATEGMVLTESQVQALEKKKQDMMKFVHWYNCQHKHSGIKFVTPAQRHSGEAEKIVRQRKQVYEDAKARNLQQWSRGTRNWELPTAVYLNPEKEEGNLKQAS